MPTIPRIQDSFPAATENQIDSFEKANSFLLPAEYRRFLTRSNGGGFANAVYFGDEKSELSIELFYAIDAPYEFWDLGTALRSYRGDLPSGLLPIADDGLGNPICLEESQNGGKVVRFNHESGQVNIVADSFDAFFAGIRYSQDPALTNWKEDIEPFCSAEQGNLALISEVPAANFETRNDSGETLLCCAAASRQAEVVAILLKRGADIEATTPNGETPLILAARANAYDVCSLLINHGAVLDARDLEGATALLAALSYENVRVAEFLIRSGADLSVRDVYGNSIASLCQSSWNQQYILPLL